MNRLTVFLLTTVTVSAHVMRAQEPAVVQSPAFEAASIRQAHFTVGCYSKLPPGSTHYAVTCTTLRELIALAWKVHPDNIQGGDASALSEFYDLTAVTPGDRPWTRDSIPPMLKQLLVERFHVAAHAGTKQISGYLLVVAKSGPKLEPSDVDAMQLRQNPGEPYKNFMLPGYVHSPGASLDVLASLLSPGAHATVVDRTGISGVFKIDLHFASDGDSEAKFPDFLTAVQEQLGLRLQPGKIIINTLRIDHVDHDPTLN